MYSIRHTRIHTIRLINLIFIYFQITFPLESPPTIDDPPDHTTSNFLTRLRVHWQFDLPIASSMRPGGMAANPNPKGSYSNEYLATLLPGG
jgi:hypothetical protein